MSIAICTAATEQMPRGYRDHIDEKRKTNMVSSLVRLKDWVSLDDAAVYIAQVLQEEVDRGDIYRLALSRRLGLAVLFPDRIYVREVSISETQGIKPVMSSGGESESTLKFSITEGGKLQDEAFTMRRIQGVYDLELTYSGRREVENLYQVFTTDSELADRPTRPGIIVKSFGPKFWELVQDEEENEKTPGSIAHRQKLDKEIADKGFDEATVEMLLRTYRKTRSDFLQDNRSKMRHQQYRPNARLPKNALLVVKASALAAFEQAITDAQKEKTRAISYGSVSSASYPWGAHNTKLLTLLSQAAMRFWQLYDPVDPTTAPTNEQVKDWLVEKNVPERTAEVMATILRADGLKMGRR